MLDVHFPVGVLLLNLLDDFMGEGFVASHGDEGIAEKVESSPCIVALDDPECE